MREGGRRTAVILRQLIDMVGPGITPKEISKKAAELMKKADLQPVVLGYDGFPDVICISVNENIVHGVPSSKKLKAGDVVKIDITPAYKNLVVDTAVTVPVGKVSPDAQRLIKGTKEALDAAIAAVKGDGTRVGDISAAAQDVMNKYKLGIIRDLVGHGVGYNIHEEPNIPNYGVAGTGPILHTGMTIAIEPMAALGDWHIVETTGPAAAIAMADGSLGAHFEHTVLITDKSAEILTRVD
jgi:methionyl aminopeptidase